MTDETRLHGAAACYHSDLLPPEFDAEKIEKFFAMSKKPKQIELPSAAKLRGKVAQPKSLPLPKPPVRPVVRDSKRILAAGLSASARFSGDWFTERKSSVLDPAERPDIAATSPDDAVPRLNASAGYLHGCGASLRTHHVQGKHAPTVWPR